jgi:hypothetical protein
VYAAKLVVFSLCLSEQPVWLPNTGVQGIDEAKAEYRVYIEKIYNALIDIRDVWDKDEYPGLVAHFAVGGRRIDPMALDAIAQLVFHMAIKIHREGASGLAFRKVAVLSSHEYDRNSSFIQRICFVAFLLKHFKYAANMFMQQSGIETRIALIWSALQQRPRFTAWWDALSQTERDNFRFALPYAGISSV